MPVEIALTPDSRWPLPFADVIDAAAVAGFSALGVPRGSTDGITAASFARRGLRCHEVLALVVTGDSDATVAFAGRLAAAASLVGARWVTTVFAPGLDVDIDALRRCAEIFGSMGAGLAVEFSPLGSVASIAEGLELVDAIGADRAGLLIDTWHFAFGPSTWDDLAAVPVEKIAYVQFSDAPPLGSEDLMSETMNRRVLPGDGSLDLDRFATTLLDRGWAGTVSVEVLNPELSGPSVPSFLERAYASTVRYWR